ncbi:hypothetical protein PVAG01_10759 [Phlyctema vagabunda]|uniref:Rhodopsin domain-containing protein n=1 Tax=Phlyctema vagabunda TaxID=108571 RepID=A0ABR4P367_9HELO
MVSWLADGTLLAALDMRNSSALTSSVVTLNIVFMSLVAVVTTLRIYIRVYMVRAAGLDDYIMVVAAAVALILSSFFLDGATHGLGKHIWILYRDEPNFLATMKHFTQSLYACYLTYATAITLTKVSIIFSYIRIFPAQNRQLRQFLLITGILIVAIWFCSIFAIIFECTPVQAAWDLTIPNGKCIDILSFFYVISALTIATDIILWITPLPYFWKMNINIREKLLLCILFSFAAFACVASILRLAQLHGLRSKDITYTAVGSANWSVAEVCTAIICASIPTMRPIALLVLPRSWFTSMVHNPTRISQDARVSGGVKLRSRCGSGEMIMRSSNDTLALPISGIAIDLEQTGSSIFAYPSASLTISQQDQNRSRITLVPMTPFEKC